MCKLPIWLKATRCRARKLISFRKSIQFISCFLWEGISVAEITKWNFFRAHLRDFGILPVLMQIRLQEQCLRCQKTEVGVHMDATSRKSDMTNFCRPLKFPWRLDLDSREAAFLTGCTIHTWYCGSPCPSQDKCHQRPTCPHVGQRFQTTMCPREGTQYHSHWTKSFPSVI